MERDIVTYTPMELTQEEEYNVFLYVLQHKKEFDKFDKKMRQALTTEMEKNGVDEMIFNNKLKVTYKQGYERVSVDTAKLKEQGLYESFTKTSPVSPTVVVTYLDNE